MPSRTQIYDFHKAHAKMVEFSGFEMPLWYKGVAEECVAVRNRVGVFDVSHMGRALITGRGSQDFLDYLTPNDVSSLAPLQAHYSVLLNERGGIIDDIVILRLEGERFLVVLNSANRRKDLSWLQENAKRFDVEVDDISDTSAMIAIQGPLAREVLRSAANKESLEIGGFGCGSLNLGGIETVTSGTGYTGEEGFEIFVFDSPLESPEKALRTWDLLMRVGARFGIQCCGLAARDVLRLEAGMCLYGSDIDEDTTPYEARIGFVVKIDKRSDFIGKHVLADQKKEGPRRVRVGLTVESGGIPRAGFPILKNGDKIGTVTSGTYSPLLKKGIAMGYVPVEFSNPNTQLGIDIRGKVVGALVSKMPFYDTEKFGWRRVNRVTGKS